MRPFAILLVTFITGCGEAILFVDPPVIFAKPPGPPLVCKDPPSMEIGRFDEQFFIMTEERGELQISETDQDGVRMIL